MPRPERSPLIDLTADLAARVCESAPDGLLIVDHDGELLLVNEQVEKMFGYDRSELLGQTVELLLPSHLRAVHQAHRAEFNSHPRNRAMGVGMLLMGRRKDGSEFPTEVSLSPLPDTADPRVIASVRDVTERHLADKERDRQARWLQGLAEVQAALLEDRPVADALELICRFASEISASTMVVIGQPDDGEDEIRVLATSGNTSVAQHETLLIDEGIRSALKGHRSVIAGSGTRVPAPAWCGDGGSALIVPLVVGSEAIGVLLLSRPGDADPFGPEIVAIVETFAGHAAVALDLSRMHRERQRLVLLEDRERIGRDLHDLVIQRLFAAGMGLEAMVGLVPEGQVADRIAETVRQLDETINDVRATIFDLSSEGNRPIARRVRAIVSTYADQLGFEPGVDISPNVGSLSSHLVQNLLPVLNEALSNVARHADASSVQVKVELTEDELILTVVDDGKGFAESSERGHGLDNIETRARQVDGTCALTRRPAGGTELVWRAPR